jgi:hypothetical protein
MSLPYQLLQRDGGPPGFLSAGNAHGMWISSSCPPSRLYVKSGKPSPLLSSPGAVHCPSGEEHAGTNEALVVLGEEVTEAKVVGRHIPSLEHHDSPHEPSKGRIRLADPRERRHTWDTDSDS